MDYKPSSEECSNGCGRLRRPGQRTCKECHNLYMRIWRRGHKSAIDKLARALAGMQGRR